MRRDRMIAVTAVLVAAAIVGMQPAAWAHGKSHGRTPTKVAWFDEGRPTSLAPGVPQLGVGPKDLLVEGITVQTGELPLPLPATFPGIRLVTAFAALSFHIPKGATPATLTLDLTGLTTAPIDAELPSGVSPVACPTTSTFKSGPQQAIDAMPKYDCSKRTSVGHLRADGKAVVFSDIARLAHGRRLSFVVLPGSLGLERLVFAAPGAGSLGLLRFGEPAPPDATPSLAPMPTPTPRSHPVPSTPSPPALSLPGGPLPTIGSVATPPEVAVTPQPAATTAVTTAAATKTDDTRARAAAIALLVALLTATAWLAFTGSPLPVTTPKQWGVGRFRAPRDGRPPQL